MRSIILSLAIFTSYLFSSFDVVELQSADYDNENIRVNSSNITSTSLIFEIDNFNVQHIDGQNGKIIRLTNGAQIMKQGAPDLPKNTSSIIIPDSEKMQAFITRTEFTEYRDYDILPSKGNLSRLVEFEFEKTIEKYLK